MRLHKIPPVRLILWVGKKGDPGGYIYVRIGIPDKQRYVTKSLGHCVPVKYWDKDNEIVTKGHKEAGRINELCRVYVNNLRETLDREYKSGAYFTKEVIEGIISPERETANFIAFFKSHIDRIGRDFTPNYKRSYTTSMNTLKEYAGEILPFAAINGNYLDKYRESLKHFVTGKPLARNTIFLRMRHVREVIDSAIEQKHMDSDKLIGYKWPTYKAPEKEYLILEQTEKLWGFIQSGDFDHNEAMKKTACYFLLECYSGLRVSDYNRFSTETIIDNRALKVRARKNGEPVYLYFDTFKRLEQIVNYIQVNNIVFDIAEPTANRNLKRIGDKIGAKFDVTTHTGRRTFGTLLAVLGYNKAEIADHMGISEETAAIYAKNTRASSRAAQTRYGGI